MASTEIKKHQQNYPKKGDKVAAKSVPKAAAKTSAPKTAPKTEAVEVKFDDKAVIKTKDGKPLVLMLAGLPGSGKSTLGKALTHLVVGAAYTDQDENGSNAGKYHAKVSSLSHAKNDKGEPLVKCLILGKGHHEPSIRQKAAASLAPGSTIIVVKFYHHADDTKLENWKALSAERIKRRGLNHHCLHPNPELGFILNSFANGWTEPTVEEFKNSGHTVQIIKLDVALSKPKAIKNLIIQLCDSGILEPLRDDKGGMVYSNDNGDLFFDPYSHLDDRIAEAVATVERDEEALRSQLKTRFWAMALTKPARSELDRHPQIKLALDDCKLKMQAELHSTMLFLKDVKGDTKTVKSTTASTALPVLAKAVKVTDGREFKEPTPEFAAEFAASIQEIDEKEMMEYATKMFADNGGEHTLTASHVVWDSNAVALIVERTFQCKNAVPHITLAVNAATKTAPVYSNELLAKPVDDASVHRIKFDIPLKLSAYLKRNLA